MALHNLSLRILGIRVSPIGLILRSPPSPLEVVRLNLRTTTNRGTPISLWFGPRLSPLVFFRLDHEVPGTKVRFLALWDLNY